MVAPTSYNDISRFAELVARLDDPFADRPAVLAAAHLDEPSYQKLLSRWVASFTQAPESPTEKAQRFGDAYARAKQALRDERCKGTVPEKEEDDDAAIWGPRFLSTEAQSWREEAAGVPLHASGDMLATAKPTPLRVPSAGIHPSGPTPTEVSKSPSLPFDGATTASPAKPLSETVDIDELLALGELPAAALPFDPSAPPSPEVMMPKEKAAHATPRMAAQIGATPDLSATLQGGAPPANVTPFEKLKAEKPIPVSDSPATTTPLVTPSAIPETPALTLERYASLCVEYAAAPARAPEIAQRYGLTSEQWASVDAYWRGKISNDPAVRAAWEKACVTYREWLMRP